jgi:hydroxyacylglutathione hydrolase
MEAGAKVLYRSVEAFKQLPEFLQVWPAHGAGSACGKALGDVPMSTIGYELRNNASIQASATEDSFVRFILTGQPEPPMYFARMKRDNKMGPKLLGHLPQPRRLTPSELGALSGRTDVAVLDTRLDRTAFMAHHLPGSLFAPLDRTFPTIAGSYVEENMPIYLIVNENQVEEAVRDLVRIGLDSVAGYATPETLIHYQENGGKLATTEVVTFADVRNLTRRADVALLDVRNVSEFQAGGVAGAQNIAHTRLWVRRGELQEGKTQVVYCRTGSRAASASSLLERLGYEVKYVDDLVATWLQNEVGEPALA